MSVLKTVMFVSLSVALSNAAFAGQGTYSGSSDFRNYCAACHGESAKGDGPVANSLKKKPADLTQLAKKNGGTFPTDVVSKTIDGRSPVSGHGGPDMPIWGDAFGKSAESSSPDAVKARINELVKYLTTIQAK